MLPSTPSSHTAFFNGIDDNSLDDALERDAQERANRTGTSGRDTLNGTNTSDTIRGRAGADLLDGRGGADAMDGGAGADTLRGGGGGDTLDGGTGDDRLFGAAGADVLNGGDGNDQLSGGAGDDSLKGGAGADTLIGGNGADELEGGAGRDQLNGGKGADLLQGGNGADQLSGGRGRDTLEGGKGKDTLTGGEGADRYVFEGQWGADRIKGFDASAGDIIDLTGTNLAFSELTIEDKAAGAKIIAGNRSILLEGIDATDVDSDWFAVTDQKGTVRDGEDDDSKYDVPDPGFSRSQLGAASIEAQDLVGLDELREDARFSAYDGEGYAVVVLDTGIDLDHPAFGPDANGDGISDRIVYTQDFTGEGDGTADDVNGHGSNVTSIVASSAEAYPGVVPGADIIHLQVLSNGGSGSFASIEAGLRWVIDNAEAYNIVAVNMSIGDSQNENSTETHPSFGDEYAALANAGVITTVAAGNDFARFQEPGHSTMATDPNVIPVGAVWEGNFGSITWGGGAKDNSTGPDRLTSFTQRSADLKTVYAPGALILGAAPGGGTGEQGGTSQAAPLVAGMAVLAQQIAENLLGRRLTPSEFHDLLIETADTIFDGDDEDDNVDNLGTELPRVNMLALAEKIAEMAGGTTPIEVEDDFAGDATTEGTLSVGGSVTGEIETGSDADWFAVRLNAGNTYRFEIEGRSLDDPFATLLDADGTVLATDDDTNDADPVIDFTPASGGTFYIAASGYGDGTGTYTVTAERTERAVTDDLPADDSTSSRVRVDEGAELAEIESPGDVDWHRIDLDGGASYEITAAGRGLDDPFLEIFTADGTRVGSDDNGAAGDNARLVLSPKSDTVYYAAVSSAQDGGTGDYGIRAETVDMGAGDIPDDPSTEARATLGETFTSALVPLGDRDWIAVTLTGGTVYSISMEGSGSNGVNDPLLRLYDDNGTQVAFDDDGGEGSNALISAYSPSDRGTYFIEAASYNDGSAGDYAILVEEVSTGSSDIPANRSTDSVIEPGGRVTSDLETEGDRDWHFTDLEEGRSYQITLVGAGGSALSDPYLRVYDAGGTLISENDDDGLTRNSSLVITGTGAADYYLSAGAYDDTGTGRYRLEIEDLGRNDDFASDSTTDGRIEGAGSLNGGIDFAGDRDWIAYFVEAGGQYQFDATARGNGGLDPTLTLRDPFGGEVAFDTDSGAGNGARITFTANTTGPIYLDVGGADGSTGNWTLAADVLTSGGDDHPNEIGDNVELSPGSSVTGTLEQQGDLDVFRFTGEAGRTYTIDLEGAPTGGGTLSDSVVAVFDSFGNLLTWNDDGPDGTTNSQVIFEAGYSGDFYVGALGFDDVTTGSYTLSLDESGAGTGPDDYGVTPATAGVFDAFGQAFGSLESEGDRDWIAVFLDGGFTYRFDLFGAPSGSGTLDDPLIRLYDSDASSLIFELDDNGANLEPAILFTPDFSDVYYLEIASFNDESAGTWYLTGAFA